MLFELLINFLIKLFYWPSLINYYFINFITLNHKNKFDIFDFRMIFIAFHSRSCDAIVFVSVV